MFFIILLSILLSRLESTGTPGKFNRLGLKRLERATTVMQAIGIGQRASWLTRRPDEDARRDLKGLCIQYVANRSIDVICPLYKVEAI